MPDMKWAITNWDYAAGVGFLFGGLGLIILKQAAASFAARVFSEAIEFVLGLGNDKWDSVVLHAAKVLEEEIPDSLSVKNRKVKSLAANICRRRWFLKGHQDAVAELIVEVASAIDRKAKAYKKDE